MFNRIAQVTMKILRASKSRCISFDDMGLAYFAKKTVLETPKKLFLFRIQNELSFCQILLTAVRQFSQQNRK